MKTKNRELTKSPTSVEVQNSHRTANRLSTLALVFSLLALGLSGFAVYQILETRQNAETTPNSTNEAASSVAKASPQSNSEPTAAPSPTTTSGQPGQRIQPARDAKGEVELLSAQRIADPESGTRDIVNVQFRVRRLSENVSAYDFINIGGTTGNNPDTNETFNPVDPVKRSTGPVSLEGMRKGASADAYVWIRVPEGISTINVSVPETETFQAVEITK